MDYPDCTIPGAVLLRPYDPAKPLMVSGTGRSGTTALARVCAALGLRHSWDARSLNAEEDVIRDAWQTSDLAAVRAIRQERGPGWVGKFPLAVHWARVTPGLMEAADCNWIVSLRDPIAEVHRDRETQPDRHVVTQIEDRLLRSTYIVRGCHAAACTGVGAAMVSYEALCDPRKQSAIIARLARWIAGTPDAAKIAAALDEVRPGDARYRGEF
jgi:hypothetical protein